MRLPSLSRSRDTFLSEIEKLEAVVEGISANAIRTQYLISEIVLIRAASLLEIALGEIAYKIACGASYVDGTAPLLLHRSSSMSEARNAMLCHNRPKQKTNLKWTKASYILDSVGKVISPVDNYSIVCSNFGSHIAEIFKVRNYAAHRSSSSRENFQSVIRLVYGRGRAIQLGNFLLSPHEVPIPNLNRYLIQEKVIVNDLTRS